MVHSLLDSLAEKPEKVIARTETGEYSKRMKKGGSMNYTYMVRCRDGSLYTGWTTDVYRRVNEHNRGRGAKYTCSRRPVELVYYESFDTKEEAMRRECAIKRLSREEKEKLIRKS